MTVRWSALVGREVELAEIERALDELDGGRPWPLAIAGEPDIGKSRLLAELRTRSEARGHLVVRGVGSEFERFVPFALVVDAFDPFLASHLDVIDELPAALRSELGSIFPSLRAGIAPGPVGTSDERYRAHRAVRALMEHIAFREAARVDRRRRTLGRSYASLELLQALLRRPPDAPVLIAIGFDRSRRRRPALGRGPPPAWPGAARSRPAEQGAGSGAARGRWWRRRRRCDLRGMRR